MSSKTPTTVRCPLTYTTPTRPPFSTPRRPHGTRPATPFGSGALSRVNTPSPARTTPGDRFIPNRAATNIEYSSFKLSSGSKGGGRDLKAPSSPAADVENERAMREKLLALKDCSPETRVLNFRQTKATCSFSGKSPGRYQYWSAYSPRVSSTVRRRVRKFNKSAEKILDAPNLLNDFYLNVLDWGKKGQLAIALASAVYVMDSSSGAITNLWNAESQSTYVSSLRWNKSGKYLALGISDGEVQLWDVNAAKLVRRFRSHAARVSSLAWDPKSSLLSCGSQTGEIHNCDPRSAQFHVHTLTSHTLDVCGLQWSPNGRFLASGGNDNLVNIWDTYSRDPWSAPAHTFEEHTAAVKALSWCPWQPSLLASGGGSADRYIRLWNASTGKMVAAQDTGSQVSGLLWSSHHHELLSSHGHPHNHLTLWRHSSPSSSLTRLVDLAGHEDRVLHMALSPDGQTVASASADETLRFWKCFTVDPKAAREKEAANLSITDLTMAQYMR